MANKDFPADREASERKRAIKALRDGAPFAVFWQEISEDGRVNDQQMVLGLSEIVLRGWFDHFRSWWNIEMPMRSAFQFNAENMEAVLPRILANCPHCKENSK